MSQPLLSWQANEFRHYPKNAAWYITAAVIVLLIIIFLVLQGDWFGALSLLIIAGIALAYSFLRPRRVNIALHQNGINLDETNIPYKEIRHFWIVDTNTHRTLNLETTAYLNRTLIVELEDQDPEEVRSILSEQVPEHAATTETFAQRVAHWLKY